MKKTKYRLTTNDFILLSKQVHGDRYDYSKVNYINKRTKVCIVCKIHGDFWQMPRNHYSLKQGCPICGKEYAKNYRKCNYHSFVSEIYNKFGDKISFPYIDKEYKNNRSDITIHCNICQKEWVCKPIDFRVKHKHCDECYKREEFNKFVEKANKIHNNKYEYSYNNFKLQTSEFRYADVKVLCSKHGLFKQTTFSHLKGCGCPKCMGSSIELKVLNMLEENNINYYYQFRDKRILGKLVLDFYLPDYKIGIECQGEQHFKPIVKFGGENSFEKIKERDLEKLKLCQENGINLIYYSNARIKKEGIIFDLEILKNAILNNGKGY